jgi:Tfp pilus assembly protein PilV
MKTFIAVFLCGIFLTAKADDQIRTVRHGTNITERPSAALATNVIELFQSAGYNSTDYAVKADTWREREQSDSFMS